MNTIKKHLIDDWKVAYKFLSLQLATLLVLLEGAYEFLPEIKGYFPDHWQGYIAGSIILARLWGQRKVHSVSHHRSPEDS